MTTHASSGVLQTPIHASVVLIRTLGDFSVELQNGCRAVWKGGGAGAEKLKKTLALLVSHCDWQIRHDVLDEVSDCRSGRPHFMSSAIGTMFKAWGMAEAFQRTRDWVCLRRHPSWRTDIDNLVVIYQHARAVQEQGHHEQALALLQEAELLCNGEYLPGYNPPEAYTIREQRQEWMAYQKQALHSLTHLALSLPSLANGLLIAERSVTRIRHLEPFLSSADAELAAILAKRLGQPRLAEYYQQQAQDKRMS